MNLGKRIRAALIGTTPSHPKVNQRPLNDRRTLDTEQVVYLTTVSNEPMAALTRQVLGNVGIRALLRPSGPGIGAWGSAATLMHDVYVLESDVARADEVLREINSGADGPLPGDG